MLMRNMQLMSTGIVQTPTDTANCVQGAYLERRRVSSSLPEPPAAAAEPTP